MNRRIKDVALMVGPLWRGEPDPIPGGRHFEEMVDLGFGVSIGPLDHDLAERVMDACTPGDPTSLVPVRQFGSRYSFVRDLAPDHEGRSNWDPDQRLRMTIALSRLIRPTEISTRFAARIFEDPSGSIMVDPAWGHIHQSAFVADPDGAWLRDEDVSALISLARDFEAVRDRIPNRLRRVFWYFTYCQEVHWIQVRGLILTAILESIVHTDDRFLRRKDRIGATTQFIGRLLTLQERIPMGLDAETLDDIYEYRSDLAHGRARQDGAETDIDLYRRVEDTVRQIIVAVIRDPGLWPVLSEDNAIRAGLPVSSFELSRRPRTDS